MAVVEEKQILQKELVESMSSDLEELDQSDMMCAERLEVDVTCCFKVSVDISGAILASTRVNSRTSYVALRLVGKHLMVVCNRNAQICPK